MTRLRSAEAGSTPLTAVPEPAHSSGLAPSGNAGRRHLTDRIATVAMHLCLVIALIPLAWILFTVVSKGAKLFVTPGWWTDTQQGVTARREGGGALHAIVGTAEITALCAVISIPIGVMVAVYLVEYGRGRLARLVSFAVDILTGVPSIVAALFVYALWVTTFGLQREGAAVSLALMLLMIPTIVRSTEEMLKLVPNELREASYALGVPKWKTIASVVLPTSLTGIVTGILLGLARVIGETAPLLILAPYTKFLNTNLFDGFIAALPTMINQERTESLQPAVDRVWAAALTLIVIVLALNLLGRLVSRFSRVR